MNFEGLACLFQKWRLSRTFSSDSIAPSTVKLRPREWSQQFRWLRNGSLARCLSGFRLSGGRSLLLWCVRRRPWGIAFSPRAAAISIYCPAKHAHRSCKKQTRTNGSPSVREDVRSSTFCLFHKIIATLHWKKQRHLDVAKDIFFLIYDLCGRWGTLFECLIVMGLRVFPSAFFACPHQRAILTSL